MAIIVTSIGSNSSIDTETPSSCSGSYSPYDVTFSTDPTGVSVGDQVEISDEGVYWATFVYRVTAISGSTYTLAYVTDDASNGDASPCELVDSWYNQAPATFKRFYSSITNWEAGLDDSDVYSSGDAAVGECHNDSVFNETVTINGGGTVGLASVKLSVHSGSRHDGTAGTGARMIPSGSSSANIIDIARDDVTVEWLELSGASASAGSARHGVRAYSSSQDNIYIRNNIIHDMKDSSYGSQGITVFYAGTNIFITNNFIYNIIQTNTVATGIHCYQGSGAEVFCNTLFNISTTSGDAEGIYVGSSAEVVKDNIVLSVSGTTASKCYQIGTGSANAASDYNLSDDTTAWGSNSVTSSDGATAANTIANTSSGSEDLHLIANSLAIGAGVDLGTTPTGVEIDIDGRNRDALGDAWDIGADQSVGLSVTITPASAALELAADNPTVSISYPSVSITPDSAIFELAADTPTATVVFPSVSITPDSAIFELESSLNDIVLGSIVIANAASALELAADNPTIGQSSVSVTPASAALEIAAVEPTAKQSSISITPASAVLELAADNPTVSIVYPAISITPASAVLELAADNPTTIMSSVNIAPADGELDISASDAGVATGSVTVTPSSATVETSGSTPNILLGSISLSPPTSNIVLSASDASGVMGSVIVAVAGASFESTGEYSEVGLGSITVDVTPASVDVSGQVGSIVSGSVSITPASGVVEWGATIGGVVAGSIIVVVPEAANLNYAASTPPVGLSSMTVDVSSAAFEVGADTPPVVLGSITILPAYSVVEIDSPDATIYAGYKLLVDPAQFVVELNPFVLRITMDSASIGYACTGALDYDIQEPTDYNLSGVVDYNAGVLTLDYAIQRALDYRYDHTS